MEVISQSSFSTRLRQAMKDSGINQAELAGLSGLSEGLISGLVNNPRKDLRASSLIAISYALDKDPLELYLGHFNTYRGIAHVWSLQDLYYHQSDAIPFIARKERISCDKLPEPLFAIKIENGDGKAAGFKDGQIVLASNRLSSRLPCECYILQRGDAIHLSKEIDEEIEFPIGKVVGLAGEQIVKKTEESKYEKNKVDCEHIKSYLVTLACDDELPQDLNELNLRDADELFGISTDLLDLVKEGLVVMAMDDKLPLDMNDLSMKDVLGE